MTIKSRANNVIDKHMESGGDHEKGLDIFFLAFMSEASMNSARSFIEKAFLRIAHCFFLCVSIRLHPIKENV